MHDIFIQYGDLLGEQLGPQEVIKLVPDFATLTGDFGLDHSMAFQVIRPRLRAQIVQEDSDKLALLKERLLAQKEAAKANGTGVLTPPLSPVPLTPPLSPSVDATLKDMGVNGGPSNHVSVPEPKTVCLLACDMGTSRADFAQAIQRDKHHPALRTTMKQASHALSEHALNIMG